MDVRRWALALFGVFEVVAAAPASAGSYSADYGTYAGYSNTDTAYKVVVAGDGSYYVAGYVGPLRVPPALPPANYSNTSCSMGCAYLYRFDADNRMVYTALIGGLRLRDMAIGPDGGAFLYGEFNGDPSINPYTPGAYRPPATDGTPRMLVKMRPDGTGIAYSTLVGGDSLDEHFGLAVDRHGAAYITGMAVSNLLVGAYGLEVKGGSDAFVAKVTPDGSDLEYVALLGGTNPDFADGIAVDDQGRVYITGLTNSDDFPATHGVRAGGNDAFVARLSADGSHWDYSTLIGGSGPDSGVAVVVAGDGAVIGGYTRSANFPTTPGAFQTTAAGYEDGLLVRVSSDGMPVATTLFGGSYVDAVTSLAINDAGDVLVGGVSFSGDFPTTLDGFQNGPALGNRAGTVAVLSGDLRTLRYATYLGGSATYPVPGYANVDIVNSIAPHPDGGLIAVGSGDTVDFPMLANANQPTPIGPENSFVFRFKAAAFVPLVESFMPVALWDEPYEFPLATTGGTGAVRWTVESGAMPGGLTISDDGRIAGTIPHSEYPPYGEGGFRFRLRATDAAGATTFKDFTLLICERLRWITVPASTLPSGTVGVEYTYPFEIAGGFPNLPGRIEALNGAPPDGLVLGYRGGGVQLYGTPNAAGTWTFKVHVEDAIGQTLERTVTVTINAAPPPPPPPPPTSGGGGGGGGSIELVSLLLIAAAAARRRRFMHRR